MNLIRVLTGLFLLAVSVAAESPVVVGEDVATVTVREVDGYRTILPRRPRRVVCVYGSLAGVWYAAGGGLAGVPSTADPAALPSAVHGLPTVGTYNQPNPEQILVLKPDLVLLCGRFNSHRRLRELLDRNHIASLAADYENYDDFLGLLALFARLNGSPEESRIRVERIKAAVDAEVAGVPVGRHPRFLCLFASPRNTMVETAGGHTADMATRLGGHNVFEPQGKSGASRYKVGMERIVLADPDMIFVVTVGHSEVVKKKLHREMSADSAWMQMRAVKSGKVYFLPAELFLFRPNERYPEAFRHLRRIMYDNALPPK